MIVIGLDLSLLSTGVCVLTGERGTDPEIKTHCIKQSDAKSVQQKLDRLVSICSQLVKTVKEEHPDVVVIEAPAMNQVWQMAAVGELHGVVKMQLYLACGAIPLIEQATKMRKHVVGSIEFKYEKKLDSKGKTRKKVNYGTVIGKNGKPRAATIKDVIETRLKSRGLVFATQDEMDAYVAARYGWDLS